MKKFWLFVVVLFALSLAVPVNARNRNFGRGSEVEIATQNTMNLVHNQFMQLRHNIRSTRYDYYGGMRYDRGIYLGRGFGAHGYTDYDHADTEKPSKCFERVVKNARKQDIEISAAQAMAFCNGQPTNPEPEQMAQEPEPQTEPEQQPTPVPTPAPVIEKPKPKKAVQQNVQPQIQEAPKIQQEKESGYVFKISAYFKMVLNGSALVAFGIIGAIVGIIILIFLVFVIKEIVL